MSSRGFLRPLRLVVTGALTVAAGAAAAIDRHPELKSRAVAWTEFDGSYLVDTNSRAEMLDFFWTVFNRPYPATGWTGSVNPPVAGTTSELWRVREYAQLNAYRALNGSPPMSEDPDKLAYVQAGALLLAQNPDKPFGHKTDSSWVGYNATAAEALERSSLNSSTGTLPLLGVVDMFIRDSESTNGDTVGHRASLLHDNSITGTLGSAYDTSGSRACVWNTPWEHQTAELDAFIAYPAPGMHPIGLSRGWPNPRWSFVPADDWTTFVAGTFADFFDALPNLGKRDTSVSARINGSTVPVHRIVRNNPPGAVTWDFDTTDLDFQGGRVRDGTTVEITIHDVAEQYPDPAIPPTIIGYHNYTYSVTFFDENKIVPRPCSPQTPLTNLSTRTLIGKGDEQLIAGFSVEGTAPVRVAVRAQGPGLSHFNLRNPAQSTRIKVYDSAGHLLGENSAWQDHPNWRLLQGTNTAPLDAREAAMILTLWPGTYTAVVSDDTGTNGVGIVEAFNIDNLSPTRLVNLSSRGFVGANDARMIAGFTLSLPKTVVIRTQGPGLAAYGVSNPVMDTVLTVVAQASGQTIATNDDWRDGDTNQRLRTDLADFAPSDTRDSALVLSLPAGAYTALVSSKRAPGVGIVELFEVGD